MIRTPELLKLLASLAAAAWLTLPIAGHAQDDAGSVVKVDLSAGAMTQSIALPQGRSAVIDLPVDARDVLVSNPQVAEAVLRSPRRIFLTGVKSGLTDAVFFDAAGRRILALNIRVDMNTSALSETINRVIPGAQVKAEAMNDSVILSGSVSSAGDADKAVPIAKGHRAKPEPVLNMLGIAGKDQVMLKVRIVEVDRQVIKQLGVQWTAVDQPGRLAPVPDEHGHHLRHQRRHSRRHQRGRSPPRTRGTNNVVGRRAGVRARRPGAHPRRAQSHRRLRRSGKVPGRRRVPGPDRRRRPPAR